MINHTLTGPLIFGSMVFKELKIQGFLHDSYAKDFDAMLVDLKQWLDQVRGRWPDSYFMHSVPVFDSYDL
jgi:NADPH-dependent curcumin reductase CurA